MADIGTESPDVIEFEPVPEEAPVSVPAEPGPEVVPAQPEPQPA